MPEVRSGTIFRQCVYVGNSPIRGGPTFLPELWVLPGLVRDGVGSLVTGGSSPQASEGWGQSREALELQLTVQHMVFVGSCGNTGNGHQHRPPTAAVPWT